MKILLADSNALIREGFKVVLANLDTNVHLVEASGMHEVMEATSSEDGFDLALLDLSIPGLEGAAGIRSLCEQLPHVPVVALSTAAERNDAIEALENGAMGYIPKSLPVDILVGALRLILAGGAYAPPQLLTAATPARRAGASLGAGNGHALNPGVALTERQREVLSHLARGKSNKEIALELDLSESTVKVHVNRILKALKVKNRSQAALAANGLDV